MRLVESFLTKNPCYTAGRKITVKGLMLHSVGCPQPRAQVFLDSWNHTSFGSACVHGFIDGNDGTVYQALPWNHRGWHCGSGSKGSGNNTHIGVEMCEPAGIPADRALPALIWRRQEHLQCGRMKQRWNCLPCFVRSLVWIRWQMVW